MNVKEWIKWDTNSLFEEEVGRFKYTKGGWKNMVKIDLQIWQDGSLVDTIRLNQYLLILKGKE